MFGNPAGLSKLVWFAALLLITGIISFYLAAVKSPVDASPAFFLMIIISQKYGFFYSVIFLILGNIVPSILGGDEMGAEPIMFLGTFVILTAVSGIFISLGIVITGIIMVIMLAIIGFFITRSLGNPGGFALTLAHAGITACYFVVLGNVMMQIL